MDTSIETFHVKCLMEWNSYNCPACYYMKHPDLMRNSYACMECDNSELLWFCITCGHVGCGQLLNAHALEHYYDTKHKYAMGVREFNVWNFEEQIVMHILKETNDQRLDYFHTYTQVNSKSTCTCPVCRHKRLNKFLKEPICMKCELSDTAFLWICLYCDYIGCSRKKNRHALQHFTKTQHPYTMQLHDFRIWDYKEHKYLHRQLHDTPQQTENKQTFRADFEKRMNRLESEWHGFVKLTETNKKMITIEERLLCLSDEKKILEEKLHEHDAKLNELLTQISVNREANKNSGYSVQSSTAAKKVFIKKLKLELKKHSPASCDADVLHNNNNNNNNLCSPAKAFESSKQNELFFIIILGLFVYYFSATILQKIAEQFINLLF